MKQSPGAPGRKGHDPHQRKRSGFPGRRPGQYPGDDSKSDLRRGDTALSYIQLEDGSRVPVSGLFVALGTADSTDIARKLGLVIENNHILIEPDTSTPLPGLYAAGDCTGGMLQIAKAVYEGAWQEQKP